MQQQPQMMQMIQSSVPATNITTEQIQKYLDENKKLIMAILDNQNMGRLAECAQYQALLQKNLMYLAAIADAQPPTPTPTPTPTVPPQMAPHPHPAMQQGAYFMQHPQAAAVAMAQQSGMFPQKVPLQFNNPHQMQDPQHQQHHIFQGQMGMRPETIHGGGNKQDAPDGGANGGDGQGNSATGHDYIKGSEEGK